MCSKAIAFHEFLLSCTQKKDEIKADELVAAVLSEMDSSCLEKKKLVETVLSHPDVIQYSKLRNVKKAFDKIFIVFNEDDRDCILPFCIQQGDTLMIINENDSINTIEKPVYELIKIDITGDSAYVHIEFDISGAIAFGNLKKINNQWVPDSAFVIGVR